MASQSIDIDVIKSTYDLNKNRYDELLNEASFIIENNLKDAKVKIHNISSRTKDLNSLLKKCEDKNIVDPFGELNDIAGLRIVCLFRSDLAVIETCIKQSFELVTIDNKIEQTDGYGYMSVHYICRMKQEYNGPRYDYIKGMKFEIQTRTLCMDAWAAVSHYLSYKGDWDVPTDLKRAMNALSGLFYVADNEFLQVYNERLKSQTEALKAVEPKPTEAVPINFDTVQAYMDRKFADRNDVNDSTISHLVHQLPETNYHSMKELDEDIERTSDLLNNYEMEAIKIGKLKSRLSKVGAIRVSLAIANEKMEMLRSINGVKTGYSEIMLPFRREYLCKFEDRSQSSK